MLAKRFEDLSIWQKSHQLVLRVYRMTTRFPKEETYGLASQMRRAAVSVPANIAEAERESAEEIAKMLGAYLGTLSAES